ncbi:hypothetical protein QBC35DRAFT_492248 [Podospora australis]|uniref:Rhodopsin domain-containing protein n=1 Tax=Podospora australis TaxID=1536484 RepID=A0AAN6WYQ7_9PEZI|nr:hypothetical protein QBC35DRAFT_492248 [Podospora australis]
MGQHKYDNPAAIVAAAAILQTLSTASVGLRFYSRRWKRQPYIVSDWLILAALVSGTGITAEMFYGVAEKAMGYPLGGTIEDPYAVTGRLNRAKHLELGYLLIGILSLGLIKLSITFLYWHLFAKVIFRRFLIVWMVLIVIWMVGFILAGLLECGAHLTALFGTPQDYLDHCGSAMPSGYGLVGSDVLTDLVTLLIPVPVLMTLQMNKRTRVLTLLTFAIGSLSVGASVAKAYIYITATLGLATEDAISILTGIAIWNYVEVHVGIIAACGPTLRAILSRILPIEAAAISLMSLLGVSLQTKTGSTLPSFVKMPASEEKLKSCGRTPSKGPSERSNITVIDHELESWSEPSKSHSRSNV